MNSITLLQTAQTQGGLSQYGTILMMVAVFAIFYFLIIRPQRKKQKETQAMIAAMKKGDKVTSIGGIRGTVQSVKDDSVIVKVDSGTSLEFTKSAIASVDNGSSSAPAKKAKEKKKEAPAEAEADAASEE